MAKIPITVMGFPMRAVAAMNGCRASPTANRAYAKMQKSLLEQARKSATSYEDFRDKIVATLKASGQPLTWTDIRTRGGLPQMFPNNGWVRRMENDVGLHRQRDQHG